ncbi:MAG: N-acetylmuramoyl-L-alanine amidase [bacterium]|nr:N-acetylmuramoyl-L-alanine amidase [candidate division KSB1 bacterium]MDH7559662.1 N-acetylmuramoyl-L-alanine amidase [bacterium]
MLSKALSMALFCWLILEAGSLAGQVQGVLVRYKEDAQTRQLRAFQQSGCHYVALDELAAALGGRTVKTAKANKTVLYLGKAELTVSPFNCFIVIGNAVRHMPIEALLRDGELFVPVQYFLEAVADYLPAGLQWDENSATLTLAAGGGAVQGVTVEEKANGTLVRIATTRRFAASDVYTSLPGNGWLYVDFYKGTVDSTVANLDDRAKIVRQWYTSQLSPELARVALRLRGNPTKRQVIIPSEGAEVWVSLPSQDTLSTDLVNDLRAQREKWRVDTIVLDPGHGGKDPGAIGPTGLYEKDVTLSVAKELRAMLEDELGLTVHMTRTGDTYPTLKQRTTLANRRNGKLFISIHANAHRSPKARGFSVYILGPAKSEEALEVARRENAVLQEYESAANGYDEMANPNFILAVMAHNEFVRESEQLAGLISRGLERWAKTPNLGVEQAGFYVLVGASMPSVLVEVGFISNREEEKLLRMKGHHKRIARGIFEGIKRFKETYETPLSTGSRQPSGWSEALR